jgi:hypothetical protein
MGRPAFKPLCRMTNEQFDVLVKLMRGNPSSAGCRAARLVVVDGMPMLDAEAKTGASHSTVFIQVKRYTKAYELVSEAFAAEKILAP